MRRFIFFIIIIGIVGGGIYFQYFLPEHTGAPVARLSQFIDTHIETVFLPISSSGVSISTHELRMLRESFKDSSTRGEGNKQALLPAMRLCDTLMSAIETRGKYVQRLDSIRTSSYVSMESNIVKRFEDKRGKKAFFSNGVTNSWARESQKLRAKIDADYALLRSCER